MDIHIRKHTGERPFPCTVPGCTYKAKTKHNLKSHGSIHTNEKKMECTICEYKTNFLSAFKEHEKSHQDNKDLKCDQCSFETKYRSSLSKHKSRYHSTEGFVGLVCPKCSKICPGVAALKSHMAVCEGGEGGSRKRKLK